MLAAERELSQEIEAVKNEALYGIVYRIVYGIVWLRFRFCRFCLQELAGARVLQHLVCFCDVAARLWQLNRPMTRKA